MHRIWPALTVLLAIGCSATASLPPQAIELNRSGVAALESGDLETAAARFELALEYHPRFVEALVNQGLVEMSRGNFGRARELLQRAKGYNPDVAQPHHGLGVLAEKQGRLDLASEHYREALRVDPGFAPARLNLARLMFAAGELHHAALEFRRAVEIAPDEPLAYSGLAECLLQLGRDAEARTLVDEVSTRFPGSRELTILKGRVLLRLGHFKEAEAVLTKALGGADALTVRALSFLAVSHLAQNQPELATAAAKRAIELDPSDRVAAFALAKALTRLGDPRQREWRKAAER